MICLLGADYAAVERCVSGQPAHHRVKGWTRMMPYER